MMNVRDLMPRARGRDVASGRTSEHPLVSFQREDDRLFDDLWRGFGSPVFGRVGRIGTISKETDGEVVVCSELPGLREQDVEVTLTDNVLSIRGEKKEDKSGKAGAYSYSERSYGAFERRIPIDGEVVADKVTAKFADGVVTVTLPKNPEAKSQARRIPISGETAEVEHQAA